MANTEAEQKAQLTNVQLLNALFALKKRTAELEVEVESLKGVIVEQDKFEIDMLLGFGIELEKQKQKTPVKFRYFHNRVKAIEESFQGFIKWYHSEEKFDKPKKKRVIKYK